MSRIEGKILTCDRCGKQVILRRKKEDKVLDGGYSRYPDYEDDPQGWVFMPSKGINDLCPDCYKLFDTTLKNFLKAGTDGLRQKQES